MAQSVAEYYVTNYTRCQVEETFLSSWQGLAYPSHTIQLFALPIQILTFYLILKRTPASMDSVKRPLLTFHFWCTILDIQFCTLMSPYFFFPSFSCFGVGLLSVLQVPMQIQLFMGLLTGFATTVAMVYLYESRSSSIQNNRFRMTKLSTKCIYYTCHYFFCCLFLLIFVKYPKDQEMAKLKVLETIPCPTVEYFNSPVVVILSDPLWIKLFILLIGPVLIIHTALHIAFYITCCLYYLFIAPSTVVSYRTRSLQRRFFIGILIQTGVPCIIITSPYVIFTVAVLEDWVTQSLTNLVVIAFGLHGMFESIVIILVHYSYRQTVKEMFCRKRNDSGLHLKKIKRFLRKRTQITGVTVAVSNLIPKMDSTM